MKRWTGILGILLLMSCGQAEHNTPVVQIGTVPLTPPVLAADAVFFEDASQLLYAAHPHAQAQVTCTFHPRLAETPHAQEVDQPVHQDGCWSCSAHHPDFASSTPATLEVRQRTAGKLQIAPASTSPVEPYTANGYTTLLDHAKATSDFHQHWLGFNQPIVTLTLLPDSGVIYSHVAVSTLINHGAWIFEPKRIRILHGHQELAKLELTPTQEATLPAMPIYDLTFTPQPLDTLSLEIHTCDSLPMWHAGAGNQGWWFVDEIIVN